MSNRLLLDTNVLPDALLARWLFLASTSSPWF